MAHEQRQIKARDGEHHSHHMVMRSKEKFQVMKAVCTDCGFMQVHTDLPRDILDDKEVIQCFCVEGE